jgi:hypothetical protein
LIHTKARSYILPFAHEEHSALRLEKGSTIHREHAPAQTVPLSPATGWRRRRRRRNPHLSLAPLRPVHRTRAPLPRHFRRHVQRAAVLAGHVLGGPALRLLRSDRQWWGVASGRMLSCWRSLSWLTVSRWSVRGLRRIMCRRVVGRRVAGRWWGNARRGSCSKRPAVCASAGEVGCYLRLRALRIWVRGWGY